VGVECVIATSSSERARELVEHEGLFDAVVIGVGAGDIRAAELAQYMGRQSHTPTVVVSEVSNEYVRDNGQSSISSTIKRVLARPRLRRIAELAPRRI
jgi:hypothetical protein